MTSSIILVWLLFLPFLGGWLSWQVERYSRTLPRWIALITMLTVLGISLWLWFTGDYTLATPSTTPASSFT